MKICKKFREAFWDVIGDFEEGSVVTMKSPVNEFCKKDDLYIIGKIPECYLRDAKGGEYTSWILADKIAAINLRTGGVSLVQASRPCRSVPNARVVTD